MPGTPLDVAATLGLRGLALGCALSLAACGGNRAAVDGNWTYYGGDVTNARYKPFDQINAGNFDTLQVAWTFKHPEHGAAARVPAGRHAHHGERRPLRRGRGPLPIGRGARRGDGRACAGCTSEDEGKRAEHAPRVGYPGAASRTGPTAPRNAFSTSRPGYRLRRPRREDRRARSPTFGDGGAVDLKQDFDEDLSRFATADEDALTMADVGLHASPVVAGDTDHRRRREPRRYDAGSHEQRQGLRPRLRRPDRQAALDLSHHPAAGRVRQRHLAERLIGDYTGNTGVWAQIAVDEELGLAYLPVETPTDDYYGGHRPGNNLFAESLVCVDLKTGERKWHYQLVHHPFWDFDISSAPILADITVNGRAIKAVAQPDQAGVPVRVRSRDRRAGLADRGAAGEAGRRARRVVFADAAVADQAAGLRSRRASRWTT